MSYRRGVKRSLVLDDDDDGDIYYSFKVLLPNGTSVKLTVNNPEPEMSMQNFVNLVKEEYDEARKNCVLLSKRTRIDWKSGGKFYLESNGEKMKGMVRFAVFKPYSSHIIRLDDGSGVAPTMYENLWDLTPDTDLLKELPENYSFETALADLIDNSLQAVWPPREGDRKLISVDVSEDRVSVFDTGIGMDSSEENSIDKWGKIGASLHRSHKIHAIGGKPPYLKPYFGMFGYGGPYASMFLGRRTLVSSKTKESKKVFTLEFKKEALIDNRSIVGNNWKTGGGMKDPTEEEIKLSPHGSLTKVEIFESEFDRKAPPPRSLFLSKKGMFGVVALLGSVASTSLSRVLSEYLGKDTMLSLVCKSSQFGPKSDAYRKLQSEAASLGRSITNRFLVICLDATRPWMNGLVKNDPQKRLAMDNPYLPNGDPIPGFKGYAVNMIDLASEELNIQAQLGYGLRETLFYGVFWRVAGIRDRRAS